MSHVLEINYLILSYLIKLCVFIGMRFINVAHKYINNIDVENTMKVVKYLFD